LAAFTAFAARSSGPPARRAGQSRPGAVGGLGGTCPAAQPHEF
jgi:hypothetical protein